MIKLIAALVCAAAFALVGPGLLAFFLIGVHIGYPTNILWFSMNMGIMTAILAEYGFWIWLICLGIWLTLMFSSYTIMF